VKNGNIVGSCIIKVGRARPRCCKNIYAQREFSISIIHSAWKISKFSYPQAHIDLEICLLHDIDQLSALAISIGFGGVVYYTDAIEKQIGVE